MLKSVLGETKSMTINKSRDTCRYQYVLRLYCLLPSAMRGSKPRASKSSRNHQVHQEAASQEISAGVSYARFVTYHVAAKTLIQTSSERSAK